jgi:pyruvate dehydrogenase E1 component alpha subunit
MNMASIWNLPVIYVVENNAYGMGTKFSRMSETEMVKKAASHGVPATVVDGQDVMATYTHFEALFERVRQGAGPQFVDVECYRFKGHSMSDPVSGTYRSKEEVDDRKENADPIKLLRDRLFMADLLTGEELEAIDKEVRAVVDTAAELAEAAPEPEVDTLYKNVYSEINPNGRLFFDGRGK